MALTENEKKILLTAARSAIKNHLGGDDEATAAPAQSPALSEHRGAFVTLHKAGALRGCIGMFTSDKSLYNTVKDMAINAATEDPRFPRVTPEELPGLAVEISALTPLRKTSDVTEIEVGRHGIYIISGANRGVLLPQVAVEHGFDRDTFLDQTCLKAGLSAGSWKAGAEIYIFEAEVFSEEK